jgi:hypothetical protein
MRSTLIFAKMRWLRKSMVLDVCARRLSVTKMEEEWKEMCFVCIFIRMEYVKDGDVVCCL